MRIYKYVVLVCLLSCDAKAESTLKSLSLAMGAFGDAPSKAAFEDIEQLVEKSDPELEQMTNAAPLLAAVFEYRAAQKYQWKIIGSSVVARVAKELVSGKSKLTAYINDDSQVDATKLDIWWSSYNATRDESYLKKVLYYVDDNAPKSDLKRLLLARLAAWSFASNCKAHESVRNFAQRCLANPLYTSKATFLRTCVSK